MKNNKYHVNVTDATGIMHNIWNEKHISQGRIIHNLLNQNQNTEQKSTKNTYNTISVINDK